MNKVFVYGTLKQGFRLHRVLMENGRNSVFLGEDTICGFKMLNLGAFPGIVPTSDPMDTVFGEVYVVSDETLEVLDDVEGVPYLYTRESVVTEAGRHEVFVYQFARATEKSMKDYDVVEGGEWKKSSR